MRTYKAGFFYPVTLLLLWFTVFVPIIIFLYHRVLPAYLVADDYEWWKFVRHLDFFNSFRSFLPYEFGGREATTYYRPVVGWILWFNTVVIPLSPVTFHLTSLLFHLINTLLVGLIALYSFGRAKAMFLASLFFVVFPFQGEAVNYIMYNTVMTTFYLLSFISVIQYERTRSLIWAGTACLMFLLSLLSFDSAATLPLAAFLFFLLHQRNNLKLVYKRYRYFFLSLFLVFIFYFALRTIVLNEANPYPLARYINSSFNINNAFRLYLGTLFILFLLRIFVKNIFRIFVSRENIFWFYCILTGVLFLPTFYIPTQERHLYLPSFTFALTMCAVTFSIDLHLWRTRQFLRKTMWVFIACMLVFSGTILIQRNDRWVRAGQMAEKISKEIAEVVRKNGKEKKFYLINFPDSVDGVYMYRVRAQEAIEFALGSDVKQKLVFTPLVNGTNSKVSIVDAKSILLKSDQGFVLFLPQKDHKGRNIIKNNEFFATEIDKSTLRIDFLQENFDIKKSNIVLLENGDVKFKLF